MPAEILRDDDHIRSWLKRYRNVMTESVQKVIWTNGVFDLFHAGHAYTLQAAKEMGGFGDLLIVGVNTDSSVQCSNEKGPGRPICRQEDRFAVVASHRDVDAVVPFDDPTPYEKISIVRPNILVKGGDYLTRRPIVGEDIVLGSGGEVRFVPVKEGPRTSDLITKIAASAVEERNRVLSEVFTALHGQVTVMESDLAVLLHCMIHGTTVKWSEYRSTVQMLRGKFRPDHPVWKHVEVT